MNDLTTVKEVNPVELYAETAKVDEILDAIRQEAKSEIFSVKTAKGRKAIASMAAKVSRSKTYLDDLGKNLVSDWKTKAKNVDKERRRIRDALDNLKREVRAPLTAWETAERTRVDKLQERVEQLKNFACEFREGRACTSKQLRDQLSKLHLINIDDSFQELKLEAESIRDNVALALENLILKRDAHEKTLAELEEHRKAQALREQQARDENLKREAVEQEQRKASAREKEEKARRDSEIRAADQRAYRAEIAAEQAADRERQRIEAQRQQEEDETRRRAADKKHRATIETAAADSLITFGLSKEQAGIVVAAIRMKQIPNVTIQY